MTKFTHLSWGYLLTYLSVGMLSCSEGRFENHRSPAKAAQALNQDQIAQLPPEEVPFQNDPNENDPEEQEHSSLSNVVVFSGQAAELGRQQAERFGEQARALVDSWLNPKLNVVPVLGPMLARAQISSMYVPQEFRDEIEAFSRDAKLDPELTLLASAAADLGAFVSQKAFGCSSVVVMPDRSATGSMILGRNLDYYESMVLADQWEASVFAKTGKLKILSVHIPGLIGVLSAINEKGVAMMIHVSTGALANSGIPSSIGFRKVLESAKSTSEAVAIITSLQWTFAMNILVADGITTKVVEVDAQGHAVRDPEPEGTIYVANHFLDETMQQRSNSFEDNRWSALKELSENGELVTVDDVEEVTALTGGFDGASGNSNILALVIDYEAGEITFASDPTGEKKAIEGDRRISINYRLIFSEIDG